MSPMLHHDDESQLAFTLTSDFSENPNPGSPLNPKPQRHFFSVLHHDDEDQPGLHPHIRTPKPNPRPDPWTRYFTFNIDINNDSLNPLTRSQTCPDIRIVPEFCP
ncbi:Interleukin-1 Beta [Manis pentadactyla]|nr:Interleukin-1 Beta [Manis pentadactyla]